MTNIKNKYEKYVVAITNPTITPSLPQEFLHYLHPETTYQIIPAIPRLFRGSAWDTVLQLLPHSKYKQFNSEECFWM